MMENPENLPAVIPRKKFGHRDTPIDKKSGPVTVGDIRKGLLEAAGVTKQELAQVLRKAIDTTVEQMDALNSQTFAYMGKIGDTVYSADNKTRLKAAEQALKFVDQMPRATKDNGPKVASVVINLPNIYSSDVLKDKPLVINTEAKVTNEDPES